jgi:hypothetical protein
VMLRACKPFQITAFPCSRREPALRVALRKQSTAYRRSYLVENHQGIQSANQAGFGGS